MLQCRLFAGVSKRQTGLRDWSTTTMRDRLLEGCPELSPHQPQLLPVVIYYMASSWPSSQENTLLAQEFPLKCSFPAASLLPCISREMHILASLIAASTLLSLVQIAFCLQNSPVSNTGGGWNSLTFLWPHKAERLSGSNSVHIHLENRWFLSCSHLWHSVMSWDHATRLGAGQYYSSLPSHIQTEGRGHSLIN